MTSQNASAHDEESNPSNRIPAKMTTRFFSRTQAAVVFFFSVGCSIALCGCKNDEGDPEADIMKLWADAVARYRAVDRKTPSGEKIWFGCHEVEQEQVAPKMRNFDQQKYPKLKKNTLTIIYIPKIILST